MTQSPSYSSKKLELRNCPEKGGYGIFAVEPIQKDELLFVWGGEIRTEAELDQIPVERLKHGLQIEEDVYLIPLFDGDMPDYVNHCCTPNAGLRGQISLVAMRAIQKDEEICFDYAMSDSSDYDEFVCHCGVPHCRRVITGNDWKLPELQQRYKGYFSTYLQRCIDQLNQIKKTYKQTEAGMDVPEVETILAL